MSVKEPYTLVGALTRYSWRCLSKSSFVWKRAEQAHRGSSEISCDIMGRMDEEGGKWGLLDRNESGAGGAAINQRLNASRT